MATKIVEIDDKFSPGAGTVKLKVTLGDGQPGTYNVFLDNHLFNNSATIDLGTAENCKGKMLSVVATIRDVRPETNWTSITLELADATNSKTLGPYSRKVDKDFGKIIYSIDIDMI